MPDVGGDVLPNGLSASFSLAFKLTVAEITAESRNAFTGVEL